MFFVNFIFKNCQTVNCQMSKMLLLFMVMPSITCSNTSFTLFQSLLYPHGRYSLTPTTDIGTKHRRH